LLGSAGLKDVVREALAQNWTLAARKAAVERARDIWDSARGGNEPNLSAGAQTERQRIGATEFGPDARAFPVFSAYGAGFTASYDPDLFGGRKRRIEEAAANAQADAHELDDATLTLIGNVALRSIEIAVTAREINLTNDIIASDEQTQDLVRRAHAAGAAPNTDVDRITAQLDHDRAALPQLNQRLQASQVVLATLVGRSPMDWQAPRFQITDFALPSALPTVLPSELARQRPDILAAEDRLHAASAAIGIASADLYPRIDLSAVVSQEGLFGGPTETAWTLLGGAAAPIFNGGELLANKHAAEAAYRARFADYQQTVVISLGQVATALNALSNDAETLAAQQEALVSATRSLHLYRQGYTAGSADLTALLQTQRLYDECQLSVEKARGARLADTVRLFLALGLPMSQESASKL